ncbi:MAG: helix-turn-helix transcriptional regulator [Prevotella sp.]|nr:helix-turn-helix transcriptional regulator [Prevotella sp.]
MTNREVARRAGISEQLFGKYVNGHVYPSFERLHLIADALELRVKDLFHPIS